MADQKIPGFCQLPAAIALDNLRFIGKNTHELIVLPIFGSVLSADLENPTRLFFRAFVGPAVAGMLLAAGGPRVASTPSGLFLDARNPSEPWLWVSDLLGPGHWTAAVDVSTSAKR